MESMSCKLLSLFRFVNEDTMGLGLILSFSIWSLSAFISVFAVLYFVLYLAILDFS